MEHDADVVAIGSGTGPGGETVPAVILAVRDECLPIFVSPDQAQSIGMAMEGEPFERPLAHDLLLELLTEFGGAVNRVRIDDLIDGTFYAKVDVERYDEGRPERFVFDARPSDALALATRVDCPIVVTDEVVEEAGQPPEVIGFDVAGPRDVDEPEGIEDRGSEIEPASGKPPGEEVTDVIGDELDEAAEESDGDGDDADDGDHGRDDVEGSDDGGSDDGGGDGGGDDGASDGASDGGSDGDGDANEFEDSGVAEGGDGEESVDDEEGGDE